jgi:hypothetical protein
MLRSTLTRAEIREPTAHRNSGGVPGRCRKCARGTLLVEERGVALLKPLGALQAQRREEAEGQALARSTEVQERASLPAGALARRQGITATPHLHWRARSAPGC